MQQHAYPTRIGGKDRIIGRTHPTIHQPLDRLKTLSKAQAQFYDDNGYLLLPKLFNEDEVGLINNEIKRIQREEYRADDPGFIAEPNSGDLRTVYNFTTYSKLLTRLAQDQRILNIVKDLLADDLCLYQARVNLKPAFRGNDFWWHSDFETWVAEDGLTTPASLSIGIALTPTNEHNGALMVVPGSHKYFISCGGQTPKNHHAVSLKKQQAGLIPEKYFAHFAEKYGITTITAEPGSAWLFDCNLIHGSAANMSHMPRNNLFLVYRAAQNKLGIPISTGKPRPNHITIRSDTVLEPLVNALQDHVY